MDNFIEIYNDVFDKKYCELVMNYFDDAEKNNFVLNRYIDEGAKKTIKDDNYMFIPSTTYYDMGHMHPTISKDFHVNFWEKCYSNYAYKYSILHDIAEHCIRSLKIQKIRPGQGYHAWHCEAGARDVAHRISAWTVYLNDNFEAGETEFLYQQYRYKPKQGDVIIFPASYTHAHRGNPPIGGDKYIISGWVEY